MLSAPELDLVTSLLRFVTAAYVWAVPEEKS